MVEITTRYTGSAYCNVKEHRHCMRWNCAVVTGSKDTSIAWSLASRICTGTTKNPVGDAELQDMEELDELQKGVRKLQPRSQALVMNQAVSTLQSACLAGVPVPWPEIKSDEISHPATATESNSSGSVLLAIVSELNLLAPNTCAS